MEIGQDEPGDFMLLRQDYRVAGEVGNMSFGRRPPARSTPFPCRNGDNDRILLCLGISVFDFKLRISEEKLSAWAFLTHTSLALLSSITAMLPNCRSSSGLRQWRTKRRIQLVLRSSFVYDEKRAGSRNSLAVGAVSWVDPTRLSGPVNSGPSPTDLISFGQDSLC